MLTTRSVQSRAHRPARHSAAPWLALSFVLTVAFVVLRYGLSAQWALVAAQFVYLAAPLAGVVLCGLAARLAPRGTRAEAIWGLLCSALALVSITEIVYAVAVVAGEPPGSFAAGISDASSLAAALVFLVFLGVVSSVDRLDRGRAARVVLDLVAVATLAFALVFRFGVVGLLPSLDHESAAGAVRLAGYAAVGFLVLLADAVAFSRIRSQDPQPWTGFVGGGIGVYSIGVMLWPLWALRSLGGQSAWWGEPFVSVVLLVGYELLAVGALLRVASQDAPWYRGAHAPETGTVWPGLVATSLVFTSAVALAWATFASARGSAEQVVYLGALFVATTCLVARTALSSEELWRLEREAASDYLTGAHGRQLLEERIGERLFESNRYGEPFGLALANLDDFAAINSDLGRSEGDRLLSLVAGALGSAAGAQNVFRLAGDEFTVLFPDAGPDRLDGQGERMLAAISSVGGEQVRLSASVGLATCPADATTTKELLLAARAAQLWAKQHGKGRVATYDANLFHGVSTEGGRTLLEARGSLEIVMSLIAVSDARDPRNFRHARNTSSLACLLAGYAGMNAREIQLVEITAMMHDIGKLAVPDDTPMTKAQRVGRRLMLRDHPALGEALLGAVGFDEVPLWVRSHHERWDGDGYPDALAGDAIPFGARIIALANAYDSMTSGMRSGLPMSRGAALQEIDLGIGSRFDPKLAELFIALVGASEGLGWRDAWSAA